MEQEKICADILLTILSSKEDENSSYFYNLEKYFSFAEMNNYEFFWTKDLHGILPVCLGNEKIWMKDHSKIKNIRDIYPGYFNPLHEGHLELKSIADSFSKQNGSENEVLFEISVESVYKAPITFHEICHRLEKFEEKNLLDKVVITKYPRFIDKIKNVIQHGKNNLNLAYRKKLVLGADSFSYFVKSLSLSFVREEFFSLIQDYPDSCMMVFNRLVDGKLLNGSEIINSVEEEDTRKKLLSFVEFVDIPRTYVDLSSTKVRQNESNIPW